MSALPGYVNERLQKWDALVAKREASPAVEPTPLKVTLKDGKVLDVTTATTPMDIAKQLSNSLAKVVVVAKVDGKYWDLTRPLETDCMLELFNFDSEEGRHCFWHSSAHILGEAIELEFSDAKLCIGPPLEDSGFYYDVSLPVGQSISPADYEKIQKRVNTVIKEKQNFERLVLTKQEALDLFADNKFKQEIITLRIPDGEVTTAYRCGPLIDLCRGPHLPNTGKVVAMMITRNSSAYWNADATKDALQRVYGVSFPSKAQLEEHKELLKQAEERDHRRIGTAQQLFFFNQLSPGSAFFLPHGARLYNKLQSYIRAQYHKRGYDEVYTPNMYNVELWKQSGHYQNYKENMFLFDVEGAEFALKPMNCPGHCVMFANRLKSYRDLPIRYADFGVLHRNELSGALTGLTRVRRFQQDDAHIFCRRDQLEVEVGGVLDMLQEVYGHFGFTFNLCLSTRPEKFLGEVALWDQAEASLTSCLNDFCSKYNHTWSLNPGDGAFYGPKIDIQLTDALKRKHQCGTCQLDFQLPIRFGLSYRAKDVHEEKTEEEADKPKVEKKKIDKNDKEAKAARAAAYREAAAKRKAEEEAAKSSGVPAETPEVEAVPEATQEVKVEEAVELDHTATSCCDKTVAEYEWKEIPLPPGHERPVMIHRAILGSVERMIAVLIEHTGGVWPFWLNPRQVCVVPISEHFFEYARKVQAAVHTAGFHVDLSDSHKQFNKRVAEALSEGYNFILVVGAKEEENNSVNVRFRESKQQVEYSLEDVIKMFKETEEKHL